MLLRDWRRSCSRTMWPLAFVALLMYIWYIILSGYNSSRHRNGAVVATRSSAAYHLISLDAAPVIHVSDDVPVRATNPRCTHYTCFDVYKCDTLTRRRIGVFVYPVTRFVDSSGVPINEKMSSEFRQLLAAITDSEYYTSNPDDACLFVPSVDMLSQSYVKLDESSRILSSLSHWNSSHLKDRSGCNHLIFNLIPGSYPSYSRRIDLDVSEALIAGGGFDTWSFRSGFDIAVPVYSPFSRVWHQDVDQKKQRMYLMTSAQYQYVGDDKKRILLELQLRHANQVLLLTDRCSTNDVLRTEYETTKRCIAGRHVVQYPDILTNSTFCLILPTAYLSTPLLSEALMTSCIPVIASDHFVLPFDEKIDWKRASIRIREQLIPDVVSMLSHISIQRIQKMRAYGFLVYETYFKSMREIALTTLEILNDRLIPAAIRRKDQGHHCHNHHTNEL